MSGTLTIYGASDDLIEIEGDVREEFDAYNAGPKVVRCSDGSAVRIEYTGEGCWEVRVVSLAVGTTAETVPHDNDKTTYTDRLTLTAPMPFTWVSLGRPS